MLLSLVLIIRGVFLPDVFQYFRLCHPILTKCFVLSGSCLLDAIFKLARKLFLKIKTLLSSRQYFIRYLSTFCKYGPLRWLRVLTASHW